MTPNIIASYKLPIQEAEILAGLGGIKSDLEKVISWCVFFEELGKKPQDDGGEKVPEGLIFEQLTIYSAKGVCYAEKASRLSSCIPVGLRGSDPFSLIMAP